MDLVENNHFEGILSLFVEKNISMESFFRFHHHKSRNHYFSIMSVKKSVSKANEPVDDESDASVSESSDDANVSEEETEKETPKKRKSLPDPVSATSSTTK